MNQIGAGRSTFLLIIQMKINVHVKDKVFLINCNEGIQNVRWTANAALTLYDHYYTPITSMLKLITDERDQQIEESLIINQTLKDESHIWAILEDETEDE